MSKWADLWFANHTLVFAQLSNILGWQHLDYVSKGPCIQQKPAAGLKACLCDRKWQKNADVQERQHHHGF